MNLKSVNLLSIAALLFGLITLFASSSVLFNFTAIFEKTGTYPSFILWMNLLSSPLYLAAAVGLNYSKSWSLHLLLVILIMLFISLSFFIVHMQNDKDYELETLMALFLRIAFTSTLAFFAFDNTIKEIKQ